MQQELAKAGDFAVRKYYANTPPEHRRGPRIWQLMRDAQVAKIKEIRDGGFDKLVHIANPVHGEGFLPEVRRQPLYL